MTSTNYKTVEEIAAIFGRSPATIYNWIRQGLKAVEGESKKLNRQGKKTCLYVDENDVKEYLSNRWKKGE